MMFSLYAFLVVGARDVSIEALATELTQYFKNEQDFSLSIEILPFARTKSVVLKWGEWLARVIYEEGEYVEKELTAILEASPFPDGSPQLSCRRVRVVFGSDPANDYTNQVIYVIDFLREISGASIFDPQKKEFF